LPVLDNACLVRAVEPPRDWPGLIPELQVGDLQESVRFYRDAGFTVAYERPEEAFVMLVRDGVALMLESADGPGRRLGEASLERPFGRGINLQIRVADADELHRAITAAGCTPLTGLEDRWFRVGAREVGNREFVVSDPDGYLLRFFEDLGTR